MSDTQLLDGSILNQPSRLSNPAIANSRFADLLGLYSPRRPAGTRSRLAWVPVTLPAGNAFQ